MTLLVVRRWIETPEAFWLWMALQSHITEYGVSPVKLLTCLWKVHWTGKVLILRVVLGGDVKS